MVNKGDIYFDIYQNDDDEDGFPYWEEMNWLNSNPKLHNGDPDGDGMPDWWETKNGLNTMVDDANEDDDSDHLTNIEEWELGYNPILFEANLVVSFEWDIDESELLKFIQGLQQASNFLIDVTDTYMHFRHIRMFKNGVNWDSCDIRIYDETADDTSDESWPAAHVGGYRSGDPARHIRMPRMLDADQSKPNPPVGPEHPTWYRSLIHEWGHYGLSCWEEYKDANGVNYSEDGNGIPQGPDSIMNYQYVFSELTTEISYQQWTPPNGVTTEHYDREDECCWKTFFDNYIDVIWFDLDEDGEWDYEYDMTYESNVGPEISETSRGSHCVFDLSNM
jgi:hypothetical protein